MTRQINGNGGKYFKWIITMLVTIGLAVVGAATSYCRAAIIDQDARLRLVEQNSAAVGVRLENIERCLTRIENKLDNKTGDTR